MSSLDLLGNSSIYSCSGVPSPSPLPQATSPAQQPVRPVVQPQPVQPAPQPPVYTQPPAQPPAQKDPMAILSKQDNLVKLRSDFKILINNIKLINVDVV